MEWVRKGAATFLVWVIVNMLEEREKKLNKQCNEIVISRSNMGSDQSTMDSIVSPQRGFYTVHKMMQIANITMLKIWSILISKADKQERKAKLTRSVPDSADAVNNVSEEMTTKKIRYAHDNEEISNKLSKEISTGGGRQ
ncbi:uncharacterized protein LOC131623043 [Vicia villosa]|uniref:uncharacterized protein LOC131623043 n=1 Tax=Vicia villosa TaxID=3911 RepID=UPI00273C1896|nr:uncharacterized protein LOC131623043 [Vicia villosa]